MLACVARQGRHLSTAATPRFIPCKALRAAQVFHPFPNSAEGVMRPFPSIQAVSRTEADPFLLCDHFGPTVSTGKATDPDQFDTDWHPHRGMDLMTYITEGVGRHADSMGNRGEFASPGLQWISCGSGIEHAEGGGTPVGQRIQGFQVWINVPGARKFDDPRYGTCGSRALPTITDTPGVTIRVLAGESKGVSGPFKTVQSVQMVDIIVDGGATATHAVPEGFDTALLYCHAGAGSLNGIVSIAAHGVAVLDASSPSRQFSLTGSAGGVSAILFAGKRINEPIAWERTFVMTTKEDVRASVEGFKRGTLPSVRAPWDYKRISAFPQAPNKQ